MKRAVVFVLGLLFALAACPEHQEVIDQVGGAPKEQVDVAKRGVNAAERKAEARAAEADAANE